MQYCLADGTLDDWIWNTVERKLHVTGSALDGHASNEGFADGGADGGAHMPMPPRPLAPCTNGGNSSSASSSTEPWRSARPRGDIQAFFKPLGGVSQGGPQVKSEQGQSASGAEHGSHSVDRDARWLPQEREAPPSKRPRMAPVDRDAVIDLS